MTGVWFAIALAVLTGVVDTLASGVAALGLVGVVGAELAGALVVAVPVLLLVGGAVRATSRTVAVGAYAAGALVARLLVGPLLGSAVGSAPASPRHVSSSRPSGVVCAAGRRVGPLHDPATPAADERSVAFRPGRQSSSGGVPGPSAAPAPASR